MATIITPALDDEVRRYANDEISSEEYYRLVAERWEREDTRDSETTPKA